MRKNEYKEYLQSDEWKEKRERVLMRDNHTCRKCGSNKNLHVHHLQYENVGEESTKDLITLCSDCHEKEHVNKPKVKRKQQKRRKKKSSKVKYIFLNETDQVDELQEAQGETSTAWL